MTVFSKLFLRNVKKYTIKVGSTGKWIWELLFIIDPENLQCLLEVLKSPMVKNLV